MLTAFPALANAALNDGDAIYSDAEYRELAAPLREEMTAQQNAGSSDAMASGTDG